tara:strand:+ start:404 stop:1261 length:858 start_codon:yes stop_codon:yes gene_type:complete
MESVKRLVVKLGLKQVILDSGLYRYYIRSAGNPFYLLHALRWNFARLLTSRKQVSINGVKLSLPVRNWVTHFRWFLIKKKEPEVRDWVDEKLSDSDILYDIGGNMGLISMYAAKKYPGIKILAFEPEYSNLALIKENLKFNNVRDRVETYSIALGEHDGISHLHIQDDEEGAAAHTESTESISVTDEGYKVVWREGIACYTLDKFVEMSGVQPTAMKIDTDGNELKILKGGMKTIAAKQLRTIIIETPIENDQKTSEFEQILTEQGFVKEEKRGLVNVVWSRESV